jgi:hypothetical protein
MSDFAQAALAGAVMGTSFALAFMAAYAARAAYTMTRQRSWYQLKKL